MTADALRRPNSSSPAPSTRRATRCGRLARKADQLAQWWGPKGSTLRVVRLDFRPGGIFHYAFQFQPGHDLFGRFIYREIVPPEKIVFVSSFSDAQGGIAHAPFPGRRDLAREVHNIWTLTESERQDDAAPARLSAECERSRAEDLCRHVQFDEAGLWRHPRSARRFPGESRERAHQPFSSFGDNVMTIALIILAVIAASSDRHSHLCLDAPRYVPRRAVGQHQRACQHALFHSDGSSSRQRMVAVREGTEDGQEL